MNYLFSLYYNIINAVLPEVNVAATCTIDDHGVNVIINCFDLRENPSNNSFIITHTDTNTTVSSKQTYSMTNVQVADLGTYRCDVTNEAGTGSASVTIEQEGMTLYFSVEVLLH